MKTRALTFRATLVVEATSTKFASHAEFVEYVKHALEQALQFGVDVETLDSAETKIFGVGAASSEHEGEVRAI